MAGNVERKSSVLLFAEFFKGYGIALGIIIAAIPFVSSSLDLLPNYSANKDILTFFTSLFSLMAVAILFSIRRHIGNRVFPPARRVLSPREYRYKKWFGIIIPCIFACVSFLSLITYLEILDRSVDQVALDFSFVDDGSGPITLSEGLENKEKLTAWLFNQKYGNENVTGFAITKIIEGSDKLFKSVRFGSEEGVKLVLKMTPSTDIRYRWVIDLSYVLMFLCAVISFVWLGLIEYIQDALNLDDKDILVNPYRLATDHFFKIPEIVDLDEAPASLFFTLGFSPEENPPRLIHGPVGPFCLAHRNKLKYQGGNEKNTHTWVCSVLVDKKEEKLHTVSLDFDTVDLEKIMRQSALKELGDLSAKIRVSS